MNFRHLLKMLEFDLWHFWKMSKIHCIKNVRNYKSTFDMSWTSCHKCLYSFLFLVIIKVSRKMTKTKWRWTTEQNNTRPNHTLFEYFLISRENSLITELFQKIYFSKILHESHLSLIFLKNTKSCFCSVGQITK